MSHQALDDPDEDLAGEFSRLKAEIATELRRMGGGDMDSVDKAMKLPERDEPYRGLQGIMPPMPRDVVVPEPPQPPPSTVAPKADDDDDIGDFYAMKDSLMSRITSQGDAPAPAARVPLKQPAAASEVVQGATKPSSNAGVQGSTLPPSGSSLTASAAHAQSNRVTLTAQQLAGSRRVAAVAKPRVTAVATPAAMMAAAAPAVAAGAVTASCVNVGAADAAPADASNRVLLSARRPGAAGGPPVLAAMDTAAAASACTSNAPPPYSAYGLANAPRGPSTITPVPAYTHSTHAGIEPSDDIASPFSASTRMPDPFSAGPDTSHDVLFGALALRSALDSHRAHYEAMRERIPAVKRAPPLPRTSLAVKPIS